LNLSELIGELFQEFLLSGGSFERVMLPFGFGDMELRGWSAYFFDGGGGVEAFCLYLLSFLAQLDQIVEVFSVKLPEEGRL